MKDFEQRSNVEASVVLRVVSLFESKRSNIADLRNQQSLQGALRNDQGFQGNNAAKTTTHVSLPQVA